MVTQRAAGVAAARCDAVAEHPPHDHPNTRFLDVVTVAERRRLQLLKSETHGLGAGDLLSAAGCWLRRLLRHCDYKFLSRCRLVGDSWFGNGHFVERRLLLVETHSEILRVYAYVTLQIALSLCGDPWFRRLRFAERCRLFVEAPSLHIAGRGRRHIAERRILLVETHCERLRF